MSTELLNQQQAFAQAYVLGHGNATQAAIEAGYSAVSARQTASRLLHTPHVQNAIQRAQAVTVRGRLATKALGVLEKFLDDDHAPPGVRVDAAKTVLDRSGMAAFRGCQDLELVEKPASEMTLAELDALAGVLVKWTRVEHPGTRIPFRTKRAPLGHVTMASDSRLKRTLDFYQKGSGRLLAYCWHKKTGARPVSLKTL